jgi:hypothetical protein
MKYLSILVGTLLFAALSTSAQNSFAHVSFAAPSFGVTPASAVSSPSFALPVEQPSPFASFALVPAPPAPDPEPVPQAIQGVFEKYNYDAYAGYTFFRFYEVPGIDFNMNGFNGSFVYWYRDRIGPDAEVFATYGNQPGINTWLTFGGIGPRVRWIKPRGIDFWAHALFGGAYMTPKTPYGGQGTVAGAVGAGVDLNGHHRHMALRIGIDGIATHFFGTFQFSPKASVGIVYKF